MEAVHPATGNMFPKEKKNAYIIQKGKGKEIVLDIILTNLLHSTQKILNENLIRSTFPTNLLLQPNG